MDEPIYQMIKALATQFGEVRVNCVTTLPNGTKLIQITIPKSNTERSNDGTK